jgi:hypothetical protein
MPHGLSGTARLGRSGTQSSDYQEPKWASNPQKSVPFCALNLANKESFGFLLTQSALWTDDIAPAAEVAKPRRNDDDRLTHVTLFWRGGKREDWLKFGKPVANRVVSRSERIESYAPGQMFGLVRWAANEYGTIHSSLDIVRAVEPSVTVTPVAQVEPGGELLLAVHGWPKVAQVFRLIDAIEAAGIDPCEAAPDHWRHIHNRLAAREVPRAYTADRHRAWLQRKALLS